MLLESVCLVSRAMAQPCIPEDTAKVIQLFTRCFISPKTLVFLFFLLFLKIFKRGYYVYSSVRGMTSSALVTAVVMVVIATDLDSEIVA